MIEFIIFVVAAIGMGHIIVDGVIFNPLKKWLEKESQFGLVTWTKRKILEMMNCYQCSGFWSGLFVGLCLWLSGHDPLGMNVTWFIVPVLFIYGCAGSYLSNMAALLMIWLQMNSSGGK